MAMLEMRSIGVVLAKVDCLSLQVNVRTTPRDSTYRLRWSVMIEGRGEKPMFIRILVFALMLIFSSPFATMIFAADGVIMKDGKMMMMKDGKPTAPMTADMPMPDGTTVTTSGVIKMKSGQEEQLKNGEMMLMNGHILKGGKATPMQPE